MDDIFPTELELDAIFTRRLGHPTHHESPAIESVDLHEIIEFITPKELVSMLSGCVYKTLKLVRDVNTTVFIPCDFGGINIFADQPGTSWDEESPAIDLIMQADFNQVYISPARLNDLNIRYPKLQIVSINDCLQARSHHTLKGGRSVENLMWTLIHHFQDSERLYKDISIFSDV